MNLKQKLCILTLNIVLGEYSDLSDSNVSSTNTHCIAVCRKTECRALFIMVLRTKA
jgi:hypothetical protein